jgi:hypothetical protein
MAKRLKQLSQERVPVMSGEDELRNRVRQHLRASAPYGIGDDVVRAIDEVIESHVIEMQAEILRRHTAEEVELGRLQASLDGLVAQYDHDGGTWSARIRDLEYQKRAALRGVEDRDTPMSAGHDGEEVPAVQHGKVGELAGRGLVGRVLLYLVLGLAMVADLITFRQVVERLLNDALVFPLVLALTATTTWVAHWAGEGFIQAREERRNIRRAVAGWSLSGIWLAMGLGAFAFRLLAPALPGGDQTSSYLNGGDTSHSTDGGQGAGAAMMLLLYVLTGAIAFTAGYRRPRPEIAQFGRTSRRLRWVRPRQSALLRDVAEARALGGQLGSLRDSRKRQYAVEVDRCRSAARRMRAEAAMLVNRLRIAPRQRPRLRARLLGGTIAATPVTTATPPGPTAPESPEAPESPDATDAPQVAENPDAAGAPDTEITATTPGPGRRARPAGEDSDNS